jgi:ankyrin repeat protein
VFVYGVVRLCVHTKDGNTPLLQAAQVGYAEIVSVLLQRGANIDGTAEVLLILM